MYEDVVKNGIAWIKENIPGGLPKINIETLNVASGSSCPLAQASGLYFGGARVKYNLAWEDTHRLGFSLPVHVHPGNWYILTLTWKEALRQELAPKDPQITWLEGVNQSDHVDQNHYRLSDLFRDGSAPRYPADYIRYFTPRQGVGRFTILDSPDWPDNCLFYQRLGEPAEVVQDS